MKKNIINNDIQWFDINLMEKIKTFAIENVENEWENCKDLTCCIIGPEHLPYNKQTDAGHSIFRTYGSQ